MAILFRIQLAGVSKPPVWRRVLVPDSFSFHQLHLVIQDVFEWSNYHLFKFSKNQFSKDWCISDKMTGRDKGTPRPHEVNVRRFIEQKGLEKFVYIYDLRDNWVHRIDVEEMNDANPGHPVCLAGKGNTPPEDCGGPWGFEDLKSLQGRNDLNRYEREELDFLGNNFDVNKFDIRHINKLLASFDSRHLMTRIPELPAGETEADSEDDEVMSFDDFLRACTPTMEDIKAEEKRKKKFLKTFVVPDDLTPNIERIKKHSSLLRVIKNLDKEIVNLPKSQKKKHKQLVGQKMQQIDILSRYLESEDYLADQELFDRGLLPEDMDASLLTPEGLLDSFGVLFGFDE